MNVGPEYLIAFAIGFFGSLHCLGMCGPIALLIPSARGGGGRILSTILYSTGRVLTYGILGAIIGSLGRSLAIFHWQQATSLIIGVLLAMAVLRPAFTSGMVRKVTPASWGYTARKGMSYFLKSRSHTSLLMLGAANGLLPCGLVYLGLAGSLDTNSGLRGALFMIAFGMGTIPMMAGAHLIGGNIETILREKLTRLLPVFLMIMALMFIIRGLGLGIPYLSPASDPHSGDIYCTSPAHRH